MPTGVSVTSTRVREASPRPRRWAARVLAVVAIAVATALSVADPASAHATLTSSNPAPDAILTKAPAAVSLRFSEAVTTVPGSLRVLGPDGSRADAGVVRHPSGNDVAVDLSDATKKGSYFVSWRVVSADSHPISGAFTFAIGAPSAAPASVDGSASEAGSGTAIVLGASRWAGYLGLALLFGGVLFLSLCWPTGWRDRRARFLLTVGWAVSLAATLLGLGVKGPDDAGLPLNQVGRPDLVTEVLGTTYGKALVARLILLAGIAIWLWLRARSQGGARSPRKPSTPSRWVGALVAVAFLATFSATGHAVAGSGTVLAFPVDMAHLAAMAAWVGGLVMLATVLLRRRQPADAANAVVPAFSRLATVSVAVLVVTGSYQTWRQVGSLPALATTTYGRELIVKLGLVAVALSFGVASRAWVRRHYGSSPVVVYAASATDLDPLPADGPAEVTPAALRTLRRTVAIEAVIAMIVLAVTAALVATPPAVTAYRPSVESNLQLGPDTAQVTAVPLGDREMEVHLYFFGPSGAPTDPQEVTATLRLPAQALGPLPVTLQGMGTGIQMGTVSVPVAGDWILTVSARTTAFDVYSQDVTLPIR